jgi:predicted nuclease with TOPRIM domain
LASSKSGFKWKISRLRLVKRPWRTRASRLQERIDLLAESVSGLAEAIKSQQEEIEERIGLVTAALAGLSSAVERAHAALDEIASETRRAHNDLGERIERAEAGLENIRHHMDALQKTAAASGEKAGNAEEEVRKFWRWTNEIKDRLEAAQQEVLFEEQSRTIAESASAVAESEEGASSS